MGAQPLDVVPLWAAFVSTLLLTLVALESGYQFGNWRHKHAAGERDAPVGGMVAAILGLLAFMLAFTFSLAATRFDSRRMTLLDESNAIGTTYLRAQLLPEPERAESRKLLREYVDVRLQAVQTGSIAEGAVRSEELQGQLWGRAVAAAEKNPASVMTGIYLQSLNEVIDLHAKRMLIGARSRIPVSIWLGLFGLAVIGMASVGYQAGLVATRRSPAMLFLTVAFAGTLLLIFDLDRPYEGLLQVSQQSMVDLQKSMQTDPMSSN
jgi:hypothetical protein